MAFDFLWGSLNEKSLLSTILSTFFAKLLFTFSKLMILLSTSGADPGFQVRGGGALKKNCAQGGRHEHFWGISCKKSQIYAKK